MTSRTCRAKHRNSNGNAYNASTRKRYKPHTPTQNGMVALEPRFCKTLRLDPPDTRKSMANKPGNTSSTARRAIRSIWTSVPRVGSVSQVVRSLRTANPASHALATGNAL